MVLQHPVALTKISPKGAALSIVIMSKPSILASIALTGLISVTITLAPRDAALIAIPREHQPYPTTTTVLDATIKLVFLIMLSHTDCPVPYLLSKRCLQSASLTATIGNLRIPSLSMALSLITPVVVSSQPPRTSSARSGLLVWSKPTRSPPSSIIMFGLQDRHISICLSYSF